MMASGGERKRHGRIGATATLIATLSATLALGATGGGAATTERIVVNRLTGLAISGYDPVAYFTDRAARPGRPEYETRAEGAVWRFRNPGNRVAFIAHPGTYMPAFGGHDPTGIARGVAVAGHPEIWLIYDHRLYLFHSEKTRAAFAADPQGFLAGAERRWGEVQKFLAN
jgi:hypothetical protein